MTLGDLLLENRIVFVGASPETGGSPVITDYLANVTIQKLLFLQYENKTADIHMYINSPGGSRCRRRWRSTTRCSSSNARSTPTAWAWRPAGRRSCSPPAPRASGTALPNSKVMIHQPYGQVGGQVSDIEIQANEILKERERLNEILAKHTGQPLEVIEKETDRDQYFHAERGQGVRPGGRGARRSRRTRRSNAGRAATREATE